MSRIIENNNKFFKENMKEKKGGIIKIFVAFVILSFIMIGIPSIISMVQGGRNQFTLFTISVVFIAEPAFYTYIFAPIIIEKRYRKLINKVKQMITNPKQD